MGMIAHSDFIPFHRASIGEEEISAVKDVLLSGWLTTGPKAMDFEQAFARYVGCNYAVAVNSCTAALHLALDAAGITSGDEILLPTYTFTATAEVCTYMGARPVLCDSMPSGFNIDPNDVERRITDRTRALIAVHVAGEPCELEALEGVAQKHHLTLIEDAAHALPAEYRGQRIGSISQMTAFSFYATKTITTAEGGMLTTNDLRIADTVRMMRLHGIAGDAWKRYSREGSWYYEVQRAGFKCNLTDLSAALGLAQLYKADAFRQRRSAIAQRYIEAFAGVDGLEAPPGNNQDKSHSWHLFILRMMPDVLRISRREFIEQLTKRGIGTSVHFIPLHLHPYYQETFGYKYGDFPNAENAYSRCVSLPIFPDMSESDVNRVIAAVHEVAHLHCGKRVAEVA